jgi:Lipase (class 3)
MHTIVSDASTFVAKIAKGFSNANITLTGHSLGGAAAQLVGQATGYTTTTFNAPGAQQLALDLGFNPNLSTSAIMNIRTQGDAISLVGNQIGATDTIGINPPLYPDKWWFFYQNHSMEKSVIPELSGSYQLIPGLGIDSNSSLPDFTKSIVGALTRTVGGLRITSMSFLANAELNLIDPNSGSVFEFKEDAGSPLITSVLFPVYPDIATFNVWQQVGNSWSNVQSVAAGTPVSFAAGVTGFRYDGVSSGGDLVSLPDGFLFDATFAASQQVSATLTDIVDWSTADQAPVVIAANVTATHGQTSTAASSLFTASDADGDPITKYALLDTTGNGHWLVNGIAQSAAEVDITATQIAQTSYQFGAAAGQLSVRAYDGTMWSAWTEFTATPFAVSPPPSGTTAHMILRDGGNGDFEIYDLGNNAILGAAFLGTVGLDWQFVGLGGFYGTDTSDMILRNSGTGAFEVYDVSNNNITNAASLGAIGLDWQFGGFGDFSSRPGETDMILRNSSTAALEVYDISNNSLISAYSMGAVGLDWQVAGFGDFSSNPNETDMIMRNSNTGALEVYDTANNALMSAYSMGAVGLDWQVAGFGNFSGRTNETDMIMRNSNSGALEVYDIASNSLISAYSMGAVGLDWQVVGFGNFSGNANETDMMMRNSNTGALEIYNIANNALAAAYSAGAVGLNWEVGGIAPEGPSAPSASMGGSDQAAQLLQAMAGFDVSGAADGQNTIPIGAETSQQAFLTAPQHA